MLHINLPGFSTKILTLLITVLLFTAALMFVAAIYEGLDIWFFEVPFLTFSFALALWWANEVFYYSIFNWGD